MAHVMMVPSSLQDAKIFLHSLPYRTGVDCCDGADGLGTWFGDVGKFVERNVFQKAPRIAVGATTALVTGGTGGSLLQGVLTGAAGGVAAAIPKRSKNSSLLTDLGVGVAAGGAVGSAIGIYRGINSPLERPTSEIGLVGKATQAIQVSWFPESRIQGPMPISKTNVPTISSSLTKTLEKTAKAAAPLLLSAMGSGGTQQQAEQQLATTGQQYIDAGAKPTVQGYTESGASYIPTSNGGFFGGGGGGGYIAVEDPETGQITYQMPTFWDLYKTYILLGAAALVGGYTIYQLGRRA